MWLFVYEFVYMAKTYIDGSEHFAAAQMLQYTGVKAGCAQSGRRATPTSIYRAVNHTTQQTTSGQPVPKNAAIPVIK